MRVLFVTPYYVPDLKYGGPPRKIHALGKGLVAAGHSVHVLTFATKACRPDSISIDGVAVRRLRWIGRGLKQLPVGFREIRRRVEEADVVECFGLYNMLSPIGASIATRRKAPFLVEPLGMYPPRAGNQLGKHAYNRFFTRQMVRDAAATVVASNNEVRDLEPIVPREKIFLRGNGIDVAQFARLPSGSALKRKLGIPEGERVVLYIGRLSPIKNLEQLIEAFGSANVTGAKLVLVGPGEREYEHRLRAMVSDKKLAQRVVFAGPLYEEEQKAALAIADLFVLPSLNESFGNAAGEAVAANVPVLLTDTCGIASLIHGRAGYAVPLGVESIAEGIRLMLKPEFRDQRTARREEVKRELSWDKPVQQTIALYERIVREIAEKRKR